MPETLSGGGALSIPKTTDQRAVAESGTEAARALVARLADADWNFATRVVPSPIEALHPYPAKFVADLPRRLLRTLPVPPGTTVLDPFCGSGTTLVECQRRGLRAVGVDLNPIACLISKVKTSSLKAGFAATANAVVADAASRGKSSKAHVPDLPRLDHWFTPEVQLALTGLTGAIAGAPSSQRNALRLALSSIVVRVSNQDSDTRYAAVRKNVSMADVFALFRRAAERIEDALAAREHPLVPTTVLEADVLSLAPSELVRNGPVGLVITSPPYPNAYEYWLYHKYRMYWLGMNPLAVKAREIGARAHFFKRDSHTAADFARQMQQTLELLRAVLVSGGYACFVIGRSRIHGKIVDNAAIIEDVGQRTGFRRVFSAERMLAAKRKSFNPKYGRIKTETILVMRLTNA